MDDILVGVIIAAGVILSFILGYLAAVSVLLGPLIRTGHLSETCADCSVDQRTRQTA